MGLIGPKRAISGLNAKNAKQNAKNAKQNAKNAKQNAKTHEQNANSMRRRKQNAKAHEQNANSMRRRMSKMRGNPNLCKQNSIVATLFRSKIICTVRMRIGSFVMSHNHCHQSSNTYIDTDLLLCILTVDDIDE